MEYEENAQLEIVREVAVKGLSVLGHSHSPLPSSSPLKGLQPPWGSGPVRSLIQWPKAAVDIQGWEGLPGIRASYAVSTAVSRSHSDQQD